MQFQHLKDIFNFLLIFLLFSCKPSKNEVSKQNEEETTFDYHQFQVQKLDDYDLPISMLLPDETAGIGNVFHPQILHDQGSHLWSIQVGRSFVIKIEDMGELDQFIVEKKNEISKDRAFEYNFLVNEDDLIVFSKKLSATYNQKSEERYYLNSRIVVENRNYLITNQENGNSLKEILYMEKSIESIRIIKQESDDRKSNN